MADVQQLIDAQKQLRHVRREGLRPSISRLGPHFVFLGVWAVLMALAFPRPGWWWTAHGALIPAVILAVRAASAWRLVWTSFFVALVWWIYMLRWVTGVTGGGWIGLSIIMAAYFPVTLLMVRVLERRWRWPMVLVLPMAWVTTELVRGWFLAGGFGWMALSHSQAPWRPGEPAGRLIQVADLFGEHAVSFLVAMTNGMLLDLLLRPWVHRPRFGRSKPWIGVRESMILWTVAYLAALVYGWFRISQWDNIALDAPRLAVAAVQTNVPQDNKNARTMDVDVQMWGQLEALTLEAAARTPRPRLIVWPETMAPAAVNIEAVRRYQAAAEVWRQRTAEDLLQSEEPDYWRELASSFNVPIEDLPKYFADWDDHSASIRERVAELARRVDAAILIGAPAQFRDDAGRPVRRFNSAFMVRADGRYADERYDKMHRVPFGEFIPWVEAWPWLKQRFIELFTPYDQDYTLDAGTELAVFRVMTGREDIAEPVEVGIVTPICFEDTVPRVCRRLIYGTGGVKRADVLANMTNDGWFAGNDQAWQHVQAAVFRSIENRVPTVRAVNTGVSGMIDSAGRIGPVVLVDGESEQVAGTLADELVIDSRRTVFGWLGHGPVVVLAVWTVCSVVLAAIAPRDRRRLGRGAGV